MAKGQTTTGESRVNMGGWGPTQGPLQAALPKIEGQYEQDKANPLVGQGQDYLSGAIGGNYLNPATNPHLGALTSSITDPIQAQLSAQFGKAGRGGSGDAARYVSEGMTRGLAAPLFSQYNTERGLQQNAAQMAPAMSAAGSLPLDQMIQRLTSISATGKKGTTSTTQETDPGWANTASGAALLALGMIPGAGPGAAGLSAAMPKMFGGQTAPAGWW